MKPIVRHSPVYSLTQRVLGIALWGVLCSPLCAQDVTAPPPVEDTGMPQDTPASEAGRGGDDVLVRDADGNLILLQRGIDRERLMQWLNADTPATSMEDPTYAVTSVTLQGDADDEFARLDATLVIELFVDERWVIVPVGFEDATVEGTRYQGPGQASQDHTSDKQRRWWFRGKGRHELTLSLIVPVRLTSPNRRLQLTLPPTGVSRLRMRVPMARVNATPPADAWLETRAVDEGQSEIHVVGLGTRFSLQWKPQADLKRVETFLQVDAQYTVDLTTQPALLTVAQTVKALQGSFQEFEVELPQGFELIKTEERLSPEGPRFEEVQVHSDNERQVTVRLNAPVSDFIELVWTLETEFPEDGGELVLQALQVQDASIQTGEVEVIALEGFRFDEKQRSDVRRVTRPTREGLITCTYRFGNPAFRLVLAVHEVAPVYTMDPFLLLRTTEDALILDAAFRFHLRQGALEAVEVDWPGRKDESWEIRTFDLPSVEEIEPGVGAEPLTFLLEERQTGDFLLRFQATRPIRAGTDESLTLPQVRMTGGQPTNLIIGDAVNVESRFEPLGETVILPLSVERNDETLEMFPSRPKLERPRGLRINSVDHQLLCRIDVQPRKVVARADVTVDREQRLVTEVLHYDVSYEQLDEVRLLVPDSLMNVAESRAAMTVMSGDGTTLSQDGTGLKVGNRNRVRYRLPEPRIGDLQITIRYRLPEAGDESGGLRFPIVQPADNPLASLQFALADDSVEVEMLDEEWSLQLGPDGRDVWRTTEPRGEIVFLVNDDAAAADQEYSVRQALIRTWFDDDGFSRSRAQLRIAGKASVIVLSVPESTAIDGCWWNQLELGNEVVTSQSRRWELDVRDLLQDGDADQNLLTIEFHSDVRSRFGWTGLHSVDWPRLPDNVWIEQTVWEVILPADQYLFTNPVGFTPQFEWRRVGVFWEREPHPRYEDLDDWIRAEDGPPKLTATPGGNAYQFSRFGPAIACSFRSMQWWAIILTGAGLTWVIGLVLVKAPVTRNLLTIPMIVIGVATLGIWYPVPVEVLLQPSLLGMLLAMVMAWIDARVKRRRKNLSVSGPSHLGSPLPAAEASGSLSPHIGSEDSTQIRPAAYQSSSEMNSAS